jgi:hypothetical protein
MPLDYYLRRMEAYKEPTQKKYRGRERIKKRKAQMKAIANHHHHHHNNNNNNNNIIIIRSYNYFSINYAIIYDSDCK